LSTYDQQYALSVNAGFQQQCAIALIEQAEVVVAEPGTTVDHANRLSLAQQVMFYPDLWAARMAMAIIQSNTNIQGVAPSGPAADADVFAGVSSIWTSYADGLAYLQTAKVI
jgi:hypothetical protein